MQRKQSWIKSTCAYCGVGCGIEAKHTNRGGLEIRGDKTHPANFGKLCSKGMALGETVIHQGRLLKPSIEGNNCNWDQALDYVADQFSEIIREHGPQAVAFYVSGQLLTEDYYVANKLMKGFIGSSNIDTNSRLCMSSSVAGHKRAFGADCVPGCYEDLELADLIILTGSNLAWCHPVLYQRVKAAKQARPQLKIIVIDPRTTASCEIADLHLAIKPGTDVALFNGLLCYMAQHGKLNQDYIASHTEGVKLALSSARTDAEELLKLAQKTELSPQQLTAFFQHFADTENIVTVYSQGVNQSTHGCDKVNSIINCHLATGRIGKPGCGPFSVTGQPNAMGGREVGGLANVLAAHMDFGNDSHHQLISEFWQTDKLTKAPGLKAIEMFDAIDQGKIKAVWIMATNPAVSLPDSKKINRALTKCPIVVVSDCMADTDTTRHASVLLPVQGWSEKSGTVTNSERRISRQRRLLPTPGEGRPDWWIISQVAKRMGFTHAFNYRHEAEIFSEYCKMTGLGNHGQNRRQLNLSGFANLTAKEYHQLTPVQWPVISNQDFTTNEETQHNKRLFADGVFSTPSGKAQFIAVHSQPPASRTTVDYPLLLNTGRIRDQWHTMTRSGLAPRLSEHSPEPFISVSPEDASAYGLSHHQLAQISSPLGSATLHVNITNDVRQGELFAPIHWSNTNTSAAKICTLIYPHTDTLSGQPEFKCTPVTIKRFNYRSEAVLLSTDSSEFEPELHKYEYWSKQRVANGYLFRIASLLPPKELMLQLRHYCYRQNGRQLNFSNEAKEHYRFAAISHHQEQQQLNCYFWVAGKLQHQELDWLHAIVGENADDTVARSLLSGSAEGRLRAGKNVCACKKVGKNTICQAIREHQLDSVEQISTHTQAGTGCGSCIGEIQQLLSEQQAKSPAP
ncbi:nitrate reductase [Photobacterium marinum]|nr:nitrate reductase [Photobacterium marinum]